MDQTRETLRRYLLGSLPESEAEEIDVQIITDDSLSDELALAEHDLIEDHLDQSLTPEEADLFRKNFLISDERRQLIIDTSLLREYADHHGEPVITVSEPASSVLEKLKAIFTRPAFAGALVVAALLIALLAWQVFIRDTPTQLEREYAAMNAKDLSNAGEFAALSSISLASSNLRDANSASRQNVATMTETILVRLALPNGVDTPALKATISRASARIFTIDAVRSYQNPNGKEVRMLVPRSVLEKGQDQIRLESPKGDAPLTYSVTIE
jgi:hypothetical protein